MAQVATYEAVREGMDAQQQHTMLLLLLSLAYLEGQADGVRQAIGKTQEPT